jgi:hypothetical protein
MATARYKVLGQEAVGTSTVDVYTVPAGKDAIISTIKLANITTDQITVEWHIRPGGVPLADEHYQARYLVLGRGQTEYLTLGDGLTATDVVSAKSDTASSLAVTITGTEITSS